LQVSTYQGSFLVKIGNTAVTWKQRVVEYEIKIEIEFQLFLVVPPNSTGFAGHFPTLFTTLFWARPEVFDRSRKHHQLLNAPITKGSCHAL